MRLLKDKKPVIPSNVTIHFSRFIRAGTSLPRIAVATQGPQNPISNRPQPKDRKRETGRRACAHIAQFDNFARKVTDCQNISISYTSLFGSLYGPERPEVFFKNSIWKSAFGHPFLLKLFWTRTCYGQWPATNIYRGFSKRFERFPTCLLIVLSQTQVELEVQLLENTKYFKLFVSSAARCWYLRPRP